MQKEYVALIKNDTWMLVDPPLGTKPIGCKWVYKNKYKADGSLDKHKARLVAKGLCKSLVRDIGLLQKKVLRYLKGTQDFGIKYTQVDDFSLIGYSDSEFDGDKEIGLSTSGYAMSLGSGAVSWGSHKQTVPADSTTEAEYVAAVEATKEIVWLEKILEDLQVKQVQSTPLMIDNTSAIKLVKNTKFHDRTKHINTKYHLIRHHVEAKTIHLCHCSTNEKIADIFTKALGREKLERFRMMLGLTNIPSD
eukprot:PITA_05522